MVVDDQLLCQALGVVRDRTIIPYDDLDLLAGHDVAVLGRIELHTGGDLYAGRLLRAGHREEHTDLDSALRLGVCKA